MPGDFRCDRGDYARVLFSFAREAAGASSARHSLRPLIFRRRDVPGKTRAKRAARSRNCALNQATQKHSSWPGVTHGCPVHRRAVKAESKQGLGIIEFSCEYFMGAPNGVFAAYFLQCGPAVVGEFDICHGRKSES